MSKVIKRKARGVSVPVVGMTFYPSYPDTILDGYPDFPDTTPELRREQDNEYDENAVAVHIGAAKVGHLPRKVAETVGPDLDKGVVWQVSSAIVKVHPDNPDQPGLELRLVRDSSGVR